MFFSEVEAGFVVQPCQISLLDNSTTIVLDASNKIIHTKNSLVFVIKNVVKVIQSKKQSFLTVTMLCK